MWYECESIEFRITTGRTRDHYELFRFQVEFDTPVGYQEPVRYRKESEAHGENEEEPQVHYDTQSFVAFTGEGTRLDGKKKKHDKAEQTEPARVRKPMGFVFGFCWHVFSSIHCQ